MDLCACRNSFDEFGDNNFILSNDGDLARNTSQVSARKKTPD